ncbi:MAG: NAD(P)-dependent glycerol-3-phosphate dehydrogenase [Deltaproteobacteria bacterium]|jgi:glycerol-3-phosphate dehydrogenase (NAD(P)+)|nr:NAD(P)-dependent glycerol-3-phosphate dehydrogenase [Deltaproteobacteria bacterium]
MRIVVLGGGSWGTALANLLAVKGFSVSLWLRDPRTAEAVNSLRQNPRYLPGMSLHSGLRACLDAEEAFARASFCVLALPCQQARAVLRGFSALFSPGLPVICASKGIELSTRKLMSRVVAEELPRTRYAILSGPSFAAEVIRGHPGAVVLGCAEKKLAEKLRSAFAGPAFRVYSSSDVIGVEMGGALKNVIAIAAGVSDGLGFGHNARAALITRGLAEISRLGESMGARRSTFMGLSGLGDLVLTCTGDLSRNRQVGLGLAAGKNTEEIAAEMRMVAEGVSTAGAAVALGEERGVDLPVARSVQALLEGGVSAAEAVKLLMNRDLKEEYPG